MATESCGNCASWVQRAVSDLSYDSDKGYCHGWGKVLETDKDHSCEKFYTKRSIYVAPPAVKLFYPDAKRRYEELFGRPAPNFERMVNVQIFGQEVRCYEKEVPHASHPQNKYCSCDLCTSDMTRHRGPLLRGPAVFHDSNWQTTYWTRTYLSVNGKISVERRTDGYMRRPPSEDEFDNMIFYDSNLGNLQNCDIVDGYLEVTSSVRSGEYER